MGKRARRGLQIKAEIVLPENQRRRCPQCSRRMVVAKKFNCSDVFWACEYPSRCNGYAFIDQTVFRAWLGKRGNGG